MKLSRVILAALATLMLFVAGAMVVSADPPTPEATKTKPQVQPAAPNEKTDQSTYQDIQPNDAPTATGPLAIRVQSANGTAQSTFTVGETQRICYDVPGPGNIQIITSAPGYYDRTIVYGWDNGTGGCFYASVGYPTGQHTLTIYRWDPVTGAMTQASTTFTVNAPAPQSNVIVRGQVQTVEANRITVTLTQLVAGVWVPAGTYTVITGGTPGTCTQINGILAVGSYVEIRGRYTGPYNIEVCGVQGSYITVLQPNTQGSGQVFVNRGCGAAYGVGAPIYIYMQITQPGNYTLTNQGPNTGGSEVVMWQGYLTPGLWVIAGQVGMPTGARTLRLRSGLGLGGTVLDTCGYTSQTGIAAAPQGKSQADGVDAPNAQSEKAKDAKRPDAKPIDAKDKGW